jgi:hypothetical protein
MFFLKKRTKKLFRARSAASPRRASHEVMLECLQRLFFSAQSAREKSFGSFLQKRTAFSLLC